MVEVADAGSRCARCEAPLGPRDPSLRLTQQWPHFPFCSERCRMIDLGHWVTGSYRIPGQSTLPPSNDPADSDEVD